MAVAAFDLCLLQRPGAEADWPEDVIDEARARFAGMSQSDRDALTGTVLAGLPGGGGALDAGRLPRRAGRL